MSRLSKSIFMVLILALVLVLPVFAGGGKQASGDTIRIGVLLPISGSEAYYGNDMYNAYTLAVEHINNAGGVLGRRMELLPPADDGCDALMAAQAATTITSQKPNFVVGGYCSGATIPALQEFYDNNLCMLISAANSTRITDLGLKQTFMVNSPGSHAIDSLIKLIKHLGKSKVAVIHQGDDYTQNLSDLCNKKLPPAGIQIVTTQVMEKGTPDISAIVTAIRNSGADFIYWGGYFADGGNAIRQLRAGGYTGIICCGDGSASVELITAAGPAGEGVYVTSPPFIQFAEGGESFLNAYVKKFNQQPDAYAPLCYDTIMVLKAAIEKAGSIETAKVRDALQGISYKGLSGLISFAPNRELAQSNFIITKIEGGKYILYKF